MFRYMYEQTRTTSVYNMEIYANALECASNTRQACISVLSNTNLPLNFPRHVHIYTQTKVLIRTYKYVHGNTFNSFPRAYAELAEFGLAAELLLQLHSKDSCYGRSSCALFQVYYLCLTSKYIHVYVCRHKYL